MSAFPGDKWQQKNRAEGPDMYQSNHYDSWDYTIYELETQTLLDLGAFIVRPSTSPGLEDKPADE